MKPLEPQNYLVRAMRKCRIETPLCSRCGRLPSDEEIATIDSYRTAMNIKTKKHLLYCKKCFNEIMKGGGQ